MLRATYANYQDNLGVVMLNILSLGAGVQSSAVLLMSINGELPQLDHVIFADTGWESDDVYGQLEMLMRECMQVNLPLHIVSIGDIRDDTLQNGQENGKRFASIPYFIKNTDGSKGIGRRQCTREYKIEPVETFIRQEILGIKFYGHAPKGAVVRQWIGISIDEFQRAKPSKCKWKTHWYPLIEERISRKSCQQWLIDNDYGAAPRSSCIGCPFHSNHEWREMKQKRPDEWSDACEFDKLNRTQRKMKGEIYIHEQRIPLCDVDLSEDKMSLWDDECDGMCAT